jgi:hypothetical protein
VAEIIELASPLCPDLELFDFFVLIVERGVVWKMKGLSVYGGGCWICEVVGFGEDQRRYTCLSRFRMYGCEGCSFLWSM